MYEDNAIPAEPVEQWWYHAAGASGYGSSSYIDDVVLRDRDTTANGSLDERFYYLQNQHHDVVALCDTAGDVEERVNYDAYGSPIGTFSLPGAVGNRKGYAGYEYDAELSSGSSGGSHTYHVRHRVYRSDLGVWTRRDPLGYVDGMSLYGYVRQSPVIAVDAMGLTRLAVSAPPQFPDAEFGDIRTILIPIDLPEKPCAEDFLKNCHEHPQVIIAREYMERMCSRSGHPCQDGWNVSCQDWSAINCGLCTIYIDPRRGCGTLAHELIHAGDLCAIRQCSKVRGSFDDGTTELCSEFRAIHQSCCAWKDYPDEFWDSDVPESYNDCYEWFSSRYKVLPKFKDVDWDRVEELCRVQYGSDCDKAPAPWPDGL